MRAKETRRRSPATSAQVTPLNQFSEITQRAARVKERRPVIAAGLESKSAFELVLQLALFSVFFLFLCLSLSLSLSLPLSLSICFLLLLVLSASLSWGLGPVNLTWGLKSEDISPGLGAVLKLGPRACKLNLGLWAEVGAWGL